MAIATKRRRVGTRRRVWHAVLGLPLCACGGALSTDERWDADAEGQPLAIAPALDCAAAVPPGDATACGEHEPIDGYQYADAPAFWLGSQDERAVEVNGAGFFVSDAASTAEHAARFTRDAYVSVGPDGSLEDRGGHALLGYGPQAIPGDPCVGRLRAPLFAAPQATRQITLHMNLDSRQPVQAFDIWDPSGTSNGSTSLRAPAPGGPRPSRCWG